MQGCSLNCFTDKIKHSGTLKTQECRKALFQALCFCAIFASRPVWCCIKCNLRRGSPVASTLLHLDSFFIQGQLPLLNFSPQGFKKADGCLITDETYQQEVQVVSLQ